MIAELSHAEPVAPGDTAATTALRGRNAAVVVYSTYPADPRVHRATEALIEAGMHVDVFCITGGANVPRHECVGAANVTRSAITHQRETKIRYLLNYGRFLAGAFWYLARRALSKRYAVVHVHNMPDVLVFCALIPKLLGARVILDLHDPMPELMVAIYGMDERSAFVRLLRICERFSIGFADLAITPNIAFKDLFISRSCRSEKMHIVMNSPEESIFRIEQRASGRRADDTFRIMHHGSIVHRHGVDLLVQAVAQIRSSIPGVRLDIYGNATPFLDLVLALAQRLKVADIVTYHGAKDPAGIADAIRQADLGVVPNRRSVFTDTNFPTRIFEYLALGCPVIAPSTKGIRDYFAEGELLMFEPGNLNDLVAKIRHVWSLPSETQQVAAEGQNVYRAHLWTQEKSAFVQSVSRLLLPAPGRRV
ncbi:MAG TPA: glycosyltransferase family 4 protein [Opitutaceae bacterium]|nr:glycosyltransferase family 4 protein [Opitutaceae bacterium]